LKKIYYSIIKELCINCGACVIISPESFTIDENKRVVETKKYTDKPDEIEKIFLAKKACPTDAIVIEEI